LLAQEEKPFTLFEGFDFDKAVNGYNLTLEKADAIVSKPITIMLDKKVTENTFVKTVANEKYMFTSIALDTDSKAQGINKKRVPSDNLAIIWANSYSNRMRNIDQELALLKLILEQNTDSTVQLFFLSNDLRSHGEKLTICSKECAEGQTISHLESIIENRKYDGTADYSQIDISKIKADEILFFTNGIRTIHEDDIRNINRPLTLINSTLTADTELLKKYAYESNGRFIDLSKISKDEAINRYLLNSNQIRIIGSSPNLSIENVFYHMQGDRINFLSKSELSDASAWIKVELTQESKKIEKTIKFENLIQVSQNLESLWARQKIDKLNFNYKKNKQEIVEVAKQYKVLTKDMSLIVLDRVEDYVRYEIDPPEDLKSQYTQLLKAKLNKKLFEKEQALIESITLLEEQKKWYEKTFDKSKPVPVKPIREELSDSSISTQDLEMESVPEETMSIAAAMAPARRPSPPSRNKETSNNTPVITSQPKAKITLKSFDSKAAYITEIKQLDRSKWMEAYYEKRENYLTQPMFYVDVADLFYKNNLKAEALVILSNILELDFENSEYLRVFAFKAMELGQYSLAIKALEQVKEIRPFEPQSARDLALAYEQNKQAQKALEELYSILIKTWDGRFGGIKIIVINELNHLLTKHKGLDKSIIDERLLSEIFIDLRVVINWSSDNTDIDLWVTDPYGEKTFFSNKVSRIGGKISNDITQGYGPEEFLIKEAVPGIYKIQANYYGNSQQKAAIPVTIRVEVFSHYSGKREIQKNIVLRLSDEKAVIDVGEFEYEN